MRDRLARRQPALVGAHASSSPRPLGGVSGPAPGWWRSRTSARRGGRSPRRARRVAPACPPESSPQATRLDGDEPRARRPAPHRSAAAMSRTPVRSRARVPVTLEWPAPRAVGHLDLVDAPARGAPRAGPSRAASRSGGRGGRAPSSALAACGAHRPEVAQRQARCGGAAPARATPVGEPGVQRPGARLALAGAERRGRRRRRATASATRGSSARIERAVAVHEADDLRARPRSSPAKQAAPKPRRGSRDHRERRGARRSRPSRRSSRCRRRAARNPSGSRPSTQGMRRGLVEHGEDDVDHGRRTVRPGPYEARTPALRAPQGGLELKVSAMEAGTGALRVARTAPELWLPGSWPRCRARTRRVRLVARANGVQLGAGLAPLLAGWRPVLRPSAFPPSLVLAGRGGRAPRCARGACALVRVR